MAYLALILGLLVGSFLNVCIYRIPRKESLLWPASHCPECSHRLKPIDLIPVISYLIRKGKCAYCNHEISIKYPIVEILSSLVFFIITKKYGFSWLTLSYLILGTLIIITSFIDLKLQIIPNSIVFLGLIVGLIINFIGKSVSFNASILGLLIGGALMLTIFILSKGQMGGGDIKFVAMIGVYVGYRLILLITFLSFIVGATISVFLLISKIKSLKDPIPFGPFISIATFIAIIWGNDIIRWYFEIFL